MSEPLPRYLHCSAVVEGKWYNYGGKFRDDHSFDPFLIEEFDPTHQTWRQLRTTGTPPPGHIGSAATSIGSNFFVFGGLSGISYYNTVSVLDLKRERLEWNELQPSDKTKFLPQAKFGAAMISFDNRYLVTFGGGFCIKRNVSVDEILTNTMTSWTKELLYFDINTREWHLPKITGSKEVGLTACPGCTLTKVDQHRAVLFGGQDDCIRILTMSTSNPWSWTIVKPKRHSLWPSMRTFHLAFSLYDMDQTTTDPSLMVMFGRNKEFDKLTDAWSYQLDSAGRRWQHSSLAGRWTRGDFSEELVAASAAVRHTSCLLYQAPFPNKRFLVQFGGIVEEKTQQPLPKTKLITLDVSDSKLQISSVKHLESNWLLVNHSHPNIVMMEDVKKQTFNPSVNSSEQIMTTDIGISVSVDYSTSKWRKNQELEVSVQPCLSGSFRFPREVEVASSVYKLDESKNKAKKTVHVEMEHSIRLRNDEDSRSMIFLMSSHSPTMEGGELVYSFDTVTAPSKFSAGDNTGEVELTDVNNFLCIGKSKKESKAVDHTYSLRLYAPPDPTSEEHSVVIALCLVQKAFLNGCSKLIKQHYPNLTLKATKEPVFFEQDRVEIRWDEGAGLTVTPVKDPTILKREADLPISTNMTIENGLDYPPRIELKCTPRPHQAPTANLGGVCGICISGLEEEISFSHFFSYPVPMRRVSPAVSPSSVSISASGSSKELCLLVDLFGELMHKWDRVGIALEMRQNDLSNIKQEPTLASEGLSGFFREMIYQWLRKQPAESDILTKIQKICNALKERLVDEEVFAEQVLQKVANLSFDNISGELKRKLPEFQLQVNKVVVRLEETGNQWLSNDNMIETSLQVAASLKDMKFQKLSELCSKAKEIKQKCDSIVRAARKTAEDHHSTKLESCIEKVTTSSEILYKQAHIQLTIALSKTGHSKITVDNVVTSMISIAEGLEEVLKETALEMKWKKRSVRKKRAGTVVNKRTKEIGKHLELRINQAKDSGKLFSPPATLPRNFKLPEAFNASTSEEEELSS